MDRATNFASKDKRLHIVSQINSVPSAARSLGLRLASVNYITFIDSDDYVKEDMIMKMVIVAEEHQADLIVCDYTEITFHGEHDVDVYPFINENWHECKDRCVREVVIGRGGLVWGKVFKTELIKCCNIQFDEKLRMCEDQVFYLEVIKETNRVMHICQPLYIHNKVNENSITAKLKSSMFQEQMEVQEKLEHILEDAGFCAQIDRQAMGERFKSILWFFILKEIMKSNSSVIKCRIKNIKNLLQERIKSNDA